MSEEIKENPKGELEQGEFKVKKPKVKKLTNKKSTTAKIDLSKKEEVKEEEKPVDKVTIKEEPVIKEEKVEAKKEVVETKEETTSPISEITEEEVVEEVKAPIVEDVVEKQPEIKLPENIEKLVSFMEDTGGTVEDYVRLNADYSSVDKDTLLREYYKQTKPHLDTDEVDFLLEDNFHYDEDLDEERDIRKKKLAYKEEIAKATNFLEETKSKYYDEIKLRPGVTQEQQKAMDFFNRHNEEQKMVKQQHDKFKSTTKNFFNQEFKGFEFNLNDKKFRYGVNDVDSVASNQSDLTNLIGKFLDNKGEVKDYKGYHKAIFAAQNADTIANHFYEQGKADAVKDVMAKSKNLNNELRPTSTGDVFIGGMKVKAISGVDSSKLKLRINKNK
ncbi:hypothetical protein OAG46_00125 [Planctomycetota bacterium]|nr:hypothetical protein [Planctomycetota bacterium]